MAEPWERLDGESAPAFAAFVTYRDLGLTRSCGKVAAALGKSRTLMRRWSSEHSWRARASAWDREQDREHLLTMRVEQRKATERNVKVANAAVTAASLRLVELVQSPGQIKPGEVARLMEAAMKLEQHAFGLPTERLKVDATVEARVEVDLEGLTDEEIQMRMRMLSQQLDAELRDWDRELGLLDDETADFGDLM